MDPEPAFILGMMFGALLLWFVQSQLRARRERKAATPKRRPALGSDEARRLREIEELHERLAVLERIATDPAARTAAEIDKLR